MLFKNFSSIVLPEWVAIFLIGFLLVLFVRLLIWSLNQNEEPKANKYLPVIIMCVLFVFMYLIPTIYKTSFREFDNQLVPMFMHFK